MEFIQMKCPNCSADLEVENGLDSFYCKYCGTKILLSGQSSAAYAAKTISQIANRILDQREEKRKAQEESAKAAGKAAIIIFATIIVLFGIAAMIALYLT